mmetsp:Transcript_31277/g.41382  ORF Transcript_31277/g.41382 Transcript_31277/m.41382 type:complete len:91 (+) Transcript_31277:358-630(+)
MDGDSAEEETKQEKKDVKKRPQSGKKGPRRDALEGEGKKRFESKGRVTASKLASKRSQKEAIKKKKIKRNKGTVKDAPVPANRSKSAAKD